MLSYEGCASVVFRLAYMVVKSFNTKVTSSNYVVSQRIQELLGALLNINAVY